VDGVIRVYDPAYRPAKIRAISLQHYSRGALAVLRDAKAPMPIREIVRRLLADQVRDPHDPKPAGR
jgi:hypothetical protein